jgi:translation initiation factor eIF-2B subunit beta
MVRRVLWVVREETAEDGGFRAAAADAAPAVATAADSAAVSAATDGGASSVGRSLREMLDAPSKVDYSRQSAKDLKKPIHASISELIDELSAVPEHIAEQAIEHIHANEVVLTHGHDASVEAFLRAAHKKRPFELVVAETAPSYEGRATAAAMASLGVQTTLIADSAVFAMMARVNKVILGAHAVMANGGVIATAGAHPIAMAALHHSVPVVACAGLYKLSPLFPSGPEQFNQLLSPQPTLEEEDGSVSETLLEARFVNPTYDYVPPELISLLLTNIGGNHPSYVYRLVQEYYHPDDSKLWGDW